MPWPAAKPTTSSRPWVAERAQRVGEDVAADDVDDHVDAATAGQLLDRVPEAVEQHRLVGARGARDRRLLLGAHDGDGARAVPLRDLDGRRTDAAGGAVHQDGLALAEVAALGQREVRGQVVHRQRGALVEGEAVGQRERRVGGAGDQVGGVAVAGHARDPLAGRRTPSGPETTTPAKSTPRVNGGSGLSWYSPLLSSRSGNEMPTLCTSTSTSPGCGVGSGTSLTTTSAGPVGWTTWTARMRPRLAGAQRGRPACSSRSASGRCSPSRRPR